MAIFFPNYFSGSRSPRRSLLLMLISAVLVSIVFFFGWLVYPRVLESWNYHRMSQAQEQCAKFQLEPNTWVYDDTPAHLASPPADRRYQTLISNSGAPLGLFRLPPECWAKYRLFFAPEWIATYPKPTDTDEPGTVLYLGKRATDSGKEYIVVIWLQLARDVDPRSFSRFGICGLLVTPGTPNSRPAVVGRFFTGSGLAAGVPIRFEIGTADPSDPSAISIPWHIATGRNILRCEIADSVVDGIPLTIIKFVGIP